MDINDLKKIKPENMKNGDIQIIPVTFNGKTHEYGYGDEIREAFESVFGKANFMSPSKIEELITGEDLESVQLLKKILDTLKDDASKKGQYEEVKKIYEAGVRRQKNYGVLDKDGRIIPEASRDTRATDYGSGLHRLIELAEKKVFTDIDEYLSGEEWKKDEELRKAFLFKGKGAVRSKTIARAKENFKQYTELRDSLGLQNIDLAEQKLGAVIKIGDKFVQLAGTFDQLWESGILTDLKTSKFVGPGYAMQLQAYIRLLKAAGKDIKEAKILQMPFKGGKPDFYNVSPANPDIIDQMIGYAYDVYTAKSPEERFQAIKNAKGKHFDTRVGFESNVDTRDFYEIKEKQTDKTILAREDELDKYKDGKKYDITNKFPIIHINGRPINAGFAEKNFSSPEELIAAIRNIADPMVQNDIIWRAFSNLKYNVGSQKYEKLDTYRWNSDFWDKVREGLVPFINDNNSLELNKVRNPNLKYGIVTTDRSWESLANDRMQWDFKKIDRKESEQTPEVYQHPEYKDGKLVGYVDELTGDNTFDKDDERFQLMLQKAVNELDPQTMAEMTASRIMRMMDLSTRIENYFLRAHPEFGVLNEKGVESYLARTNPVLFDQYMESKSFQKGIKDIYDTAGDTDTLKKELWNFIIDKINNVSQVPGKGVGEMVDLQNILFSEKDGLLRNKFTSDIMWEKFNPDNIGHYTEYRDYMIGQMLANQKGAGRDYYYSVVKDPDADDKVEYFGENSGMGFGFYGGKVNIDPNNIKHMDELQEILVNDEIGEIIYDARPNTEQIKSQLSEKLTELGYAEEEITSLIDRVLKNLDKITPDLSKKVKLAENGKIIDPVGIFTKQERERDGRFEDDLTGFRTALAALGIDLPNIVTDNPMSDQIIAETAKKNKGFLGALGKYQEELENQKNIASEAQEETNEITESIKDYQTKRTLVRTKTGVSDEEKRFYRGIGSETKLTEGWTYGFYDNGLTRYTIGDNGEVFDDDGKLVGKLGGPEGFRNINSFKEDSVSEVVDKGAQEKAAQEIQEEVQKVQEEVQKVQEEIQQVQEEAQEIQEEAQKVQEEAQKGQEEAQEKEAQDPSSFQRYKNDYWFDTKLFGESITDRAELKNWKPEDLVDNIYKFLGQDNIIFSELVRQFFDKNKDGTGYRKDGEIADQVRELLIKKGALDRIDSRIAVTKSGNKTYLGGSVRNDPGLKAFYDDLDKISPILDENGNPYKYNGYINNSNVTPPTPPASSVPPAPSIPPASPAMVIPDKLLTAVDNIDRNVGTIVNQQNPSIEQTLQTIANGITSINSNGSGSGPGNSPDNGSGNSPDDGSGNGSGNSSGNGSGGNYRGSKESKLLSLQRKISGYDVQIANIDKAINKPGVSNKYIEEQKKLQDALRKEQQIAQDEYDAYFDRVEPSLPSSYGEKQEAIVDEASARVAVKNAESNTQKLKDAESEYLKLVEKNADLTIKINKLEVDKLKAKSEEEKKAIDALISALDKQKVNESTAKGTYEMALADVGFTSADIDNQIKKLEDEQQTRIANASLEGNIKKATIEAAQAESEKKVAESERKAAESEYLKLVEKNADLTIKINELETKKLKAKSQDEIEKIDAAINFFNKQKASEKDVVTAKQKFKDLLISSGMSEADADAEANKISNTQGIRIEGAQYIQEISRARIEGSGSSGAKSVGGSKSIWNSLGFSKDGILKTISQFFSFYRIIGKLKQEFQKIIQLTKQLDQSITNIRIVTGLERKEVDNAVLSYGKLAKELGTTTTALAESANTWLRQGYSISASMNLIEASTKLSKLGMLDMNTATKVLTSTLKGFKMEASDAELVVDKLTKLDMNYAASAGEIGEAMSRTSAIASQMGMSLDETAAMVTTLMDVTQQSSEMAGTAIRSILARYGNVKSGSFISMMTEDEDLEKINDIEKVLGVLGITIRSSKMEMRGMSDVLDELASKWNTLSSVEQNAVATAFAGKTVPEHIEIYVKNIFNCR